MTISFIVIKPATDHGSQLENVGLGEDIDPYPLDALSLAILPERLCSRYGQNERTIFSFMRWTFLNEA